MIIFHFLNRGLRKDGNKLAQEASTKYVFGPDNVNEIEPGILECCGIRMRKEKSLPWRASYHFGDDRVNFSLRGCLKSSVE